MTADNGQRAVAIQMAAYHARGADKTHRCVAATPDTPAAAKHVVMTTPSMHNVAAAAGAADVTDAICCHGDAADELTEDRSLLALHSANDVDMRRYHYQFDPQTV